MRRAYAPSLLLAAVAALTLLALRAQRVRELRRSPPPPSPQGPSASEYMAARRQLASSRSSETPFTLRAAQQQLQQRTGGLDGGGNNGDGDGAAPADYIPLTDRVLFSLNLFQRETDYVLDIYAGRLDLAQALPLQAADAAAVRKQSAARLSELFFLILSQRDSCTSAAFLPLHALPSAPPC
jgi:hypothetical protein